MIKFPIPSIPKELARFLMPPLDQIIKGLLSPEIIELLIKILVFPGLIFIMLYVMIAVWGERKLHARVHLRIGPTNS